MFGKLLNFPVNGSKVSRYDDYRFVPDVSFVDFYHSNSHQVAGVVDVSRVKTRVVDVTRVTLNILHKFSIFSSGLVFLNFFLIQLLEIVSTYLYYNLQSEAIT